MAFAQPFITPEKMLNLPESGLKSEESESSNF